SPSLHRECVWRLPFHQGDGVAAVPERPAMARMKTPKTKFQTPMKSQAPNPNSARDVAALELAIWHFSGVWSSVFGVWDLELPRSLLRPEHACQDGFLDFPDQGHGDRHRQQDEKQQHPLARRFHHPQHEADGWGWVSDL